MAEGFVKKDGDKTLAESNVFPLECAICLQQCLYPAQLPCKHIFCFLCIKGIAFQSGRCAMCRRPIPEDFLLKPNLLEPVKLSNVADTYQWYYERGSGGWWLYDPRASAEIEAAYQRGEKSCQLLLAGFMYVIDFVNMLQYRQSNTLRRRRIKRDLPSTTEKSGIAGLTEENEQTGVNDISLGMQRLWSGENSTSRIVQPGAESLPTSEGLSRNDSDNYGLESLGSGDYSDLGFNAATFSPQDGRSFNPRLDLGESDDEESDWEEDDDDHEPRRIMEGPDAVLITPSAYRPMPVRAPGRELDQIHDSDS